MLDWNAIQEKWKKRWKQQEQNDELREMDAHQN